MVDKVVNAMRVELTPWMKFVVWMVMGIFACAMVVFQVQGNTKNITKNTEKITEHERLDTDRHNRVIERIHGTELTQEQINTSLTSIDRRFERLEDYLMQYDFEKRK
jgi:hypothetical protein